MRYLEHEAEPMLRGTYGEQTGRRLFAATADLTRLAGWTSYDIAAHGLAQRYFVQALRLSQAAGDRTYGAYVLVTMSRQAVYLGHGREAVQLARVAQQGVGSSAPPAVQALLHAAEARGHGVLGEVRACTASLVRAERTLEAVRTGDDVPHWARFFDEAQLADEFGHCHRDLQQYRASAQHAERSSSCGRPASCAAGCSAGWCSPPHGSGSGSWTRRAPSAPRPRWPPPKCAPCGRTSTCGSSSGVWSPTATRPRYADTGTASPPSATDGTGAGYGADYWVSCPDSPATRSAVSGSSQVVSSSRSPRRLTFSVPIERRGRGIDASTVPTRSPSA